MLIKILQNLRHAHIYNGMHTLAMSRRSWQQLKNSAHLLQLPHKIVTFPTSSRRGQHTIPENVCLSEMDVKIYPALKNNYMYMIIDKKTREATVVDPVDPMAIIVAVHKEKVNLTQVLTTHHHLDHAGGNKELRKMWYKHLTIHGGDDRIIALNSKVKQGDRFKIGELNVRCIHTPCHTVGSICYFVESPGGDKVVFTGDTLFQGGCGMFLEGTPEQMHEALSQKLAKLPDETLVFGGHENTVLNLAYALQVEPCNEAVKNRLKWAKERRKKEATTLPSAICEEKTWNPFLRLQEVSVQEYTGKKCPEDSMTVLRKERDDFKPQSEK